MSQRLRNKLISKKQIRYNKERITNFYYKERTIKQFSIGDKIEVRCPVKGSWRRLDITKKWQMLKPIFYNRYTFINCSIIQIEYKARILL